MKKRTNSYVFFIVTFTGLLLITTSALCVDGGSGDPEGAHNQVLPGWKDVLCNRCHFPKRGKGPRIWEEVPLGAETISGTKGMRTICQTCHYPGNAVNAISGFSLGRHPLGGHEYKNGNVFLDQTETYMGEDHVMHDWADIGPDSGKLPKDIDPAFPLKKQEPWGHPAGLGDTENGGVYCGTCHDPHKQPMKQTDGTGDYLRIKESGQTGTSGERTPFCLQCHQNLPEHPQHGVSLGCQKCHHPHDGATRIEDNGIIGQWILTEVIEKRNFRALPNCTSFGRQEDGIDIDVSATCYACHNPNRSQEIAKLGAGVIYGDDTDTPREHHPMGDNAIIEEMLHAEGVDHPSPGGFLTCTSCHDGFHEGGNSYFLRDDFTEDTANFCTMCHKDKTAEGLGPMEGQGHRQIFGKSPNGRGDCMFCHFIHDGQDRGQKALPVTEAIIRVEPKNLRWAAQEDDTDTEDYEDICYGCHADIVYMKGVGAEGAMLQPEKFASHPFSESASHIKAQGGFVISDGTRNDVINDYGVPRGEIFCGSCHNIHKGTNKPYLRVDASPYTNQGFCEGCHTEHPGDGKSSHPIGVPPHDSKTGPEFPPPLFGGSSGDPRGITQGNLPKGEILCLTCHNVHAASTDYLGRPKDETGSDIKEKSHGPLLCVDNFSSDTGSDLCRLCHTPFEGICDSRHDFSGIDIGHAGRGGVCSPCHTPHKTKEKALLWPRSLTEEREKFDQDDKPDYITGVTLFCYDCHEDAYSIDNDPPSNAFFNLPQDIAYTDGPGKSSQVGYYDTIPPEDTPPRADGSPTGGHYIQSQNISGLRHGIETGDKLPCDLCHDPHARNENQAFLVNPLGINNVDDLEASRNSRNGKGTGREICASCHGYKEKDAMIGIPVKIYDFDVVQTPDTREEHSKANEAPCTNCHRHNRIVPFQNQAHLVHLVSSKDKENQIVMRARGGGENLMRGLGIKNCSTCHIPDLAYQTKDLTFIDDKPLSSTGVCQPCHSKGGSYDGVNDPLIGAKNNWEVSPYNSDGTLKLGKDRWCIGCHDEEPSEIWWPGLPAPIRAPNICGQQADFENNVEAYGFYRSGHGVAPYYKYPNSERRGAGLICTDCHDPDLPHIRINRYKAGNENYQTGYRLRSVDGKEPMTIPRWREEYWSGDFNLCFSCHKEEDIIGIGFGYRYYTTNHNPFFLVDNVATGFKNVDLLGLNRHNTTRGPTFDFINYYPSNSHWNHLAVPNALVTLSTPTGGGQSRTNRCTDSRCHSKVVWDSDKDGFLDSRPSCTTCHNPHGTRYTAMTKNDLVITHDKAGADWTFGYIGSPNYGLFGNEGDDLYCSECHAKLMRFGEGNYSYYRKPWVVKDGVSPDAPE